MAEWWKQLYGESEGKDGIGIFPASVDLTADLHSMGQYIQDGERFLQETVVFFDNVDASGFVQHIKLPHYVDFQAELSLIRSLREAGKKAADASPSRGERS